MTERWKVEYVLHILENGAAVRYFVTSEDRQCAPHEKIGLEYDITTPERIGPTKVKIVEVEKCAQGYPFFARIRAQVTTRHPDILSEWLVQNGLQEISGKEIENLGIL